MSLTPFCVRLTLKTRKHSVYSGSSSVSGNIYPSARFTPQTKLEHESRFSWVKGFLVHGQGFYEAHVQYLFLLNNKDLQDFDKEKSPSFVFFCFVFCKRLSLNYGRPFFYILM